MKKIFLVLLGFIAINVFASCDKVITVNDLPQQAQQFLKQHFEGIDPVSVRLDDGKYEVVLKNGTEIEFSRKGEWRDVDCHTTPVPAGIVPDAIANYVATKFPDNFIVKIDRDNRDYEIELNNDIDLTFDLKGNFLHLD
ncbi:MAG: PepSY-like domain-containing protein [Bacteroidales bacterium]|nr:PepSY-like domain-containing protein [Bacteroidales bacterium]